MVNALDMLVLATLSRMVVDDAWVSERFGARATPLRDAHRRLEEQAQAIAEDVVTADQYAQMQRIIDEWRRQNPHIRAVSYVHFRDFANSIGHPTSGENLSLGSLFSLLGIDPLSGLDPAVREIAQSRALAERAIYYAQRLPNLLDMQAEQMTDQFAVTPETVRLLGNIDRTAKAAEDTGRLASELPEVIAREREAAIRQFMEAINVETAHTRSLITELRGTLEAGTATSNSLTTTIRAFDQLMAGFQKPAPAGAPPATPGRPFDITEYTAAAAQITRAADELKQLIAGIEQGSPGVDAVRGSCGRLDAGRRRPCLLAPGAALRAHPAGRARGGARVPRHCGTFAAARGAGVAFATPTRSSPYRRFPNALSFAVSRIARACRHQPPCWCWLCSPPPIAAADSPNFAVSRPRTRQFEKCRSALPPAGGGPVRVRQSHDR